MVHELSVCGAIADIARQRAGDRRVTRIHLRVGQLRQIVPDTLAYCWSMASADTELDGSVLEIEAVPARITCRDCGRASRLGELPVMVCEGCGGMAVEVVAGEEFLVTALDLAEV